jgi:hypothetical protein
MLIKPVYDLIGAFGIVGGDHLGTVGTVEKQHANYPSLIPITGISPALIVTQEKKEGRTRNPKLPLVLPWLPALFRPLWPRHTW